MKTLFQRTLSGLAPADDAAERLMKRVQPGEFVKVDATVPRDQRSLAMHNLYFVVLKHVHENLPDKYDSEIPTPRILRARIFFAIGFTEIILTPDGPREIPKSLEFAKLGQAEFHEVVWIPTMRLIDKMAPGLGQAFENEYLSMVA